jgi:hypothetical protein
MSTTISAWTLRRLLPTAAQYFSAASWPPAELAAGHSNSVAWVTDAKQDGGVLTAEEVERFVRDGFVYLPEAFPRALADECRAFLWQKTGLDPDDPATWTRPVIRLAGYGGELFNAAANTPALHEAFDQLVGVGRWIPRDGLGTFPIRFPHPDDPGDAGWHMEGSYSVEGQQSPPPEPGGQGAGSADAVLRHRSR